jgi:hypothetical protein
MPRSATNEKQPTTTTNGETTSAYFRRVFMEDRSLLKKGSNAEVFERWLKDHPGHKEVPDNIKALLHAVKGRLRQKRRGRRGETTEAAPAPAAPRRTDKSLGQLEEQIDDCLAVARAMDAEGLSDVIDRLRTARNAVVRMGGG